MTNQGFSMEPGCSEAQSGGGIRAYSAGLADPVDGFGPVMVAAAAFFSTMRTE